MRGRAAIVVLAFTAVPLLCKTADVKDSDKCSIEGTVTSAQSGMALPKGDITVSRKGGHGLRLLTVTNTSGHFRSMTLSLVNISSPPNA
jgi:hypothetical protein